jgi:hypothetical protein
MALEYIWLFNGDRDRPMLVTSFRSSIPYLAPQFFGVVLGEGLGSPSYRIRKLDGTLIFYVQS